MKIVVKRNAFASALSAASTVVPLRGVRPGLRNCLLTADKTGAIEISATDLEIGLRSKLQAESVVDPVSVCLPCTMMAGLLKECKEDLVTLETIGAKGVLTIGRDRYEVLGTESSDFPDMQSGITETEKTISILAEDVASMIDRTIYAAAREQGRYAINGVYMQCKNNTLEMVSTDGRRLAVAKKQISKGGALEDGVILPVKMMQEIRKLCDSVASGKQITFALRGRSFIAATDDTTLSSLVIEGIFPKYSQVLPKGHDKEITIKREPLINALRKAVFLTSEETKTVTLCFSPGICLIEARSPEKGQAAVTLEVEYSGEEVSIGFNPQYLQDGLKVLDSETIRMELKSGTHPGMVREGEAFIYVLMPVNQKE